MIDEVNPENNGKSPVFEKKIKTQVSELAWVLYLDIDRTLQLAQKSGFIHKSQSEASFKVAVPVTRYDIMHPCDVIEDIGVVFGYNNIPKVAETNT